MPKGKILMGKTTPAKKKEMNRTAGTAKRLLGRSEAIGFKLKAGMPLTGSASGVKSITTREAGEALTQGIVTLGKKNKLQVDPANLAFALPVGKVAKAAKVLRGAGRIAEATALEARLGAKVAGMQRAGNLAERSGRTPVSELSKRTFDMGRRARKASERVFPRAAGAVGEGSQEITARLGRQSNLPMGLKRELSEAVKNSYTRFTGFSRDLSRKAAGKPSAGEVYQARLAKLGSEGMRVRELEKRLRLPEAGTSKAFGRAASKEVAKNAKIPKMTPQQAQDSYERVSDLIKGGRAAKRRGK